MKTFIHRINKGLIFVFTRAAMFYFLVFWISNSIVDYEKIKFSMQIRILNSIMPDSFASLVRDGGPGKKIDPSEMDRYIRFYQRVVDFFPEQADARAILGVCHFYNGDIPKAISMNQKAFDLNKDVFWINYNLGVLYTIKGQDREASEFLQRAVDADTDKTLSFILSSNVIYRSLMMDAGISIQDLQESLKQGRFQAHLLLLIVHERQKNFVGMLSVAENAVKTDFPVKEIFLYYAGRAQTQLKNDAKAAAFFQASLQINPELRDSYHQLAVIFERMGKTEPAADLLKKSTFKKQAISSILQKYSFNPRIF